MTIKKTVLTTSMILAMGFAAPVFAQTEPAAVEAPAIEIDGKKVELECIPQAEVDLMTAEDKEKLKLAVCEDAEASEKEKNAEGTEATQEAIEATQGAAQ